jgi:hypothetical protein
VCCLVPGRPLLLCCLPSMDASCWGESVVLTLVISGWGGGGTRGVQQTTSGRDMYKGEDVWSAVLLQA